MPSDSTEARRWPKGDVPSSETSLDLRERALAVLFTVFGLMVLAVVLLNWGRDFGQEDNRPSSPPVVVYNDGIPEYHDSGSDQFP